MTPAQAAALAQRLIAANGSTIQLEMLGMTVTDANKPWKGTATVSQTLNVQAVMLPHASTTDLGVFAVDDELLKRSAEVFLIAGQGAAVDVKNFHALLVQGTRRAIAWVRELRPAPADVPVLYAVGVAR